ncbi:hypothetical protein ACHQM5_007627 [Ranunculus cassubicifolius]
MKFFRRIAGIFGFIKDEPHEEEHETTTDHQNPNYHPRPPTKGFSVQVPVAVDRAHLGPILTPSNLADGGVQGLKWYAKRLRIDEDGDVADEFLDEVLPEVVDMPASTNTADDQRPITSKPKFEIKYRTRPAKVRTQVISVDGRVQSSVEFQGRLQWV